MADTPLIKRIHTAQGDAQIDYEALANQPTAEKIGALPKGTRTITEAEINQIQQNTKALNGISFAVNEQKNCLQAIYGE